MAARLLFSPQLDGSSRLIASDGGQIAVLSEGVVEDCGTHAELLARCETYQTLVKRQVGGGLVDATPVDLDGGHVHE
jgi:hypothetical protein